MWACALRGNVWGSEDNLWKSVLSSDCIGVRQMLRVGGKHLLTNPAVLTYFFFKLQVLSS